MTVETIDYGTFKTHAGTLAEVAAAVAGRPADHLQWFYDYTASEVTCIEKR